MNHKNDTDFLQLITSSSEAIDVIIQYRLFNDIEPLSHGQSISSATTTDIELPQGANAIIDQLSIKNKGTGSNTVTINKVIDSNSFQQFKVTLAAGELIMYVQGQLTIYEATGKIKVQTGSGGGGGGTWGAISGTLSDQTDLQAALDAKQNVITDSDDITEGAVNLFFSTAEQSKLSGIESNADVTDSTNVAASGAFMKSVDDTDDITEGSTKKFATAAEKTKLSNITVTQPVDLDDIETRVNSLDAAVVLKGSWDASSGSFPGGGTAQAGASYIVSVAGTVDGQTFAVNDRIIAIADNASTSVFASNWFKADYTDQFLSLDGAVGAVTLGAVINGLTGKTTPVDADTFAISDSAASNASKKVTWANIKATLKTYLDTLYQPINAALTSISGLSPTNDDILQRKSGAWTNRTVAQFKTDLALTKSDVGLGSVDNTSDSTKNAATATLTNKRITKRVTTITSNATPTVNSDNCDRVNITALATAITSMSSNLTGTPSDFDQLEYRIKDDGTARGITWGSLFQSRAATLPTTTVLGKVLTVMFEWDAVVGKWMCLASQSEA